MPIATATETTKRSPGIIANNETADDPEGWIPPPIRMMDDDDDGGAFGGDDNENQEAAADTNSNVASYIFDTDRHRSMIHSSQQVMESKRMAKVTDEAEALFVLSDEEQNTLSDEEILHKLEVVLDQEEQLEQQLQQQQQQQQQQQYTDHDNDTTTAETGIDATNTAGQEHELGAIDRGAGVDWLRNRRALLGNNEGTASSTSSSSVIPVLRHTLLTAEEITTLLEHHGGGNISLVKDNPEAPRMGGADGMIFCSSTTTTTDGSSDSGSTTNNHSFLIQTLSRVVIDHIKERRLDEIGVTDAKKNSTKKKSLPSSLNSATAATSWMIVDCGNYIVHIMEEITRQHLQLEALWSGQDPIWTLNLYDDEATDDYVAQYPVPAKYYHDGGTSPSMGVDLDLRQLRNTHFSSHQQVISQTERDQHRRLTRRLKRESRKQKQQQKRQDQRGGGGTFRGFN